MYSEYNTTGIFLLPDLPLNRLSGLPFTTLNSIQSFFSHLVLNSLEGSHHVGGQEQEKSP